MLIMIVNTLILIVLVLVVWTLKKKGYIIVSADINDKSFMMDEKERRSPSDPEVGGA